MVVVVVVIVAIVVVVDIVPAVLVVPAVFVASLTPHQQRSRPPGWLSTASASLSCHRRRLHDSCNAVPFRSVPAFAYSMQVRNLCSPKPVLAAPE